MKYTIWIFSVMLLLSTMSCTTETASSPVTEIQNPGIKGNISSTDGRTTSTKGVEVESSTRIADPTYADGSVNYINLAAEICSCTTESNRLNLEMEALANEKKSKEFAALAPKLNDAFTAAVKCSEGKVKGLNSEFSPYKLVPEMKQQCGELPQELVAQILRAFGVNI